MKHFKILVLALSALLLTGCYTQLQLSEAPSYSGDENNSTANAEAQYDSSSDYAEGDQEYIPIHYKDYSYTDFWRDYHFYNDFYSYPSYHNWYSYHRFHYGNRFSISRYDYWRMRHFYDYPYYGSRFSLSFSWGFGYHPYHYYDPFYHGPFRYSYYPSYNNYYFFYNNPGGGFYGGGTGSKNNDNIRYGPRSIGADRVVDRNSRVRRDSENSSRKSSVVTGQTRVRSRSSVDVTRTRGTVKRSTGSSVSRTRSRGTGNDADRARSRASIRDENNNGRSLSTGRTIRTRNITSNSSSSLGSINRVETERRLRSLMAPEVDTRRTIQNKRPPFLKRMKIFFKHSGSRLSTGSRSTISIGNRTRSSVRSSTISSGSRRSTVTRGSSSSSNSRSRGSSSSRSRSRGGGNDSSSDRSRGNN